MVVLYLTPTGKKRRSVHFKMRWTGVWPWPVRVNKGKWNCLSCELLNEIITTVYDIKATGLRNLKVAYIMYPIRTLATNSQSNSWLEVCENIEVAVVGIGSIKEASTLTSITLSNLNKRYQFVFTRVKGLTVWSTHLTCVRSYLKPLPCNEKDFQRQTYQFIQQ